MKFSPIPLHTISRWLFAVVLVVVTILALGPADDQVITTGWDKSNHLLAFFSLMWLLDFSWPAPGLITRKVIVLLVYGLLIEIIQAFTHRDPSVLDWLTDGLGLAIYVLLQSKLLLLKPVILRFPFIAPESRAREVPHCRDC